MSDLPVRKSPVPPEHSELWLEFFRSYDALVPSALSAGTPAMRAGVADALARGWRLRMVVDREALIAVLPEAPALLQHAPRGPPHRLAGRIFFKAAQKNGKLLKNGQTKAKLSQGTTASLADAGITRDDSSKWQRMAMAASHHWTPANAQGPARDGRDYWRSDLSARGLFSPQR